ncbi:MAG: hypothetical protein QXX95_06765 [Nitrososphaerales archaeon]|jgi:uncharacterized membrane protein
MPYHMHMPYHYPFQNYQNDMLGPYGNQWELIVIPLLENKIKGIIDEELAAVEETIQKQISKMKEEIISKIKEEIQETQKQLVRKILKDIRGIKSDLDGYWEIEEIKTIKEI